MISNVEKKLIDKIYSRIDILLLVVITIIGLRCRKSMFGYVSADASIYLIPWFDAIKANGGITGLGIPVADCNYTFAYQFLIALMTYIPINGLIQYKILSCIFDFALGILSYKMVYYLTNNSFKAIIGYSLVLMSPVAMLNSSLWAQCDSLYTFWLLASIYCLMKDKYVSSIVVFGVSLAFKLQAIILFPLFLLVYFVKKKFSAVYFVLVPLVIIVMSIPSIIMGRNIKELMFIYLNNTDMYKSLAVNYPSFWNFFSTFECKEAYLYTKNFAICLTLVVLVMIMYIFVKKGFKLNKFNYLYMAFILYYSAIFFLPAMHERYGYVYEILAIIIVQNIKKTYPLLIGLMGISMITYGNYLFGRPYNSMVLSLCNMVIYVIFIFILYREVSKTEIVLNA